MRILIVANYNNGFFSPFVLEQASSLIKNGIEIDYYGIVGKGVIGYLKNINGINKKIKEFRPDLIHSHYGLCGLCANLQRQVPVITTYHGSDIHNRGWILLLSRIAISLSSYNLFVTQHLHNLSKTKKQNYSIIPCGIDLDTIHSVDREDAKKIINRSNKFILFSSSFTNKIKNASLAGEAMEKVEGVELVELKGYNRTEVNLMMNAADCLLMTSHREGSPQVVKEAMACGTPIVSVDVGDVKDVIGDISGCYIAERNAYDIANKIKLALEFKGKTNGRQRIMDLGLSNDLIAQRLIEIYKKVLKH